MSLNTTQQYIPGCAPLLCSGSPIHSFFRLCSFGFDRPLYHSQVIFTPDSLYIFTWIQCSLCRFVGSQISYSYSSTVISLSKSCVLKAHEISPLHILVGSIFWPIHRNTSSSQKRICLLKFIFPN